MHRFVAAAVTALLLSFGPSALAAQPKRPKLAVTDLKAGQGMSEGTTTILTGVVVSEVSRAQRFEVLAKADLAALLGYEKQKELAGCADDTACLTIIGGAVGASYLLIGEVGKLGSRHHVSLTLLDVAKSRVVGRESGFFPADDDALADAVQKSVRKLLSSPDLPVAAVGTSKSGNTPVNVPGWATLAGGAALLIGGGICAGVAATRYEALASHQGEAGYAVRYERERGEVQTAALAADVLVGVGVAAAGVGAVLLLTGAGSSDGARASVAPALGNGFVGVVGTGRF
ncbi:MAG: hypothetical protein QM765_06425 [Myxococcales bacterium]